MTFWDFMAASPFTALIAVCCIFYFCKDLQRRLNSTVKVLVRGWPPEHLDADGDWKPEPEIEEVDRNDLTPYQR